MRGRRCKPIFVQVARQVVKMKPADLRLPSRAWKVSGTYIFIQFGLSDIADFHITEHDTFVLYNAVQLKAWCY